MAILNVMRISQKFFRHVGSWACGITALLALAATGCWNVDVNVPDYTSAVRGAPPSQIPQADPDDRQSLIRENHDLCRRVDYLKNRNIGLAKEYEKLGREIEELENKLGRARR